MTWWTGGALGLDFESDGVDPTEARAITCALISLVPSNEPVPMEVLLRPERDIPAGATAIHGISTDFADRNGTLRSVAIRQVAETIGALAGAEWPVVCHNAPYDLTLLDREMRRLHVGRLEIENDVFAALGQVRLFIRDNLATTFPVIDTLVLDKAVDKYRRGSRKLDATAAHYGAPMAEGSAHGATADVTAALRIAIAIANRYADSAIGTMTLAELHAAQAGWAGEQADGLREYFRRTGKNADDVSGDWPLRPMPAAGATEGGDGNE